MITSEKDVAAALGLSRFGLGGRRGDRTRIAGDPRGAFLAELARPGVALLDTPDLKPTPELTREYVAFRRERRKRRKEEAAAKEAARKASAMAADGAGMEPGMGMAMGGEASMSMEADAGKPGAKPTPGALHRAVYRQEVAGRMANARLASLGYAERLVLFWTNHFSVSAGRAGSVRLLVGAFEREAIRPHVLGRFEDMLLAVTRHPAMLVYLDNNGSTGPGSPVGQATGKGLNENHARELLELHTVGVHGGYDQSDVTAMARVLTGWGVSAPGSDDPGRFVFDERRHEPGAQTVMGKRYAADGEAQGRAALADLARNPATAAHVAEKLACAFVADDPPQPLVDRLRATFLDTDGDLAALARTLVQSDEAWSAPPRKLRSPQEFMFASVRALNIGFGPRETIKALDELGQGLWFANSPKGYPVRGDQWLAPNALVNRLDLAEQLAGVAGDIEPVSLAGDVLGPRLTDETMTAIRRAGSRAQGVALLLMSPEMQRR